MTRRNQPRAARPRPAPPRHVSPMLIFAVVALVLTAAVAALGWAARWPPLVTLLVALNAATFLVYAYDKAVAGRGRLRVPERLLHALALAGGTLGALTAQRLLRHKISKYAFQRTFWLLTGAQATALGAYWYFAT